MATVSKMETVQIEGGQGGRQKHSREKAQDGQEKLTERGAASDSSSENRVHSGVSS
jgi:hypothetical protein